MYICSPGSMRYRYQDISMLLLIGRGGAAVVFWLQASDHLRGAQVRTRASRPAVHPRPPSAPCKMGLATSSSQSNIIVATI